jgi:hypothetical protein
VSKAAVQNNGKKKNGGTNRRLNNK